MMKITKLEYGDESSPLTALLQLNHINNATATVGTVILKKGQRVPDGAGESVHDQDEVSLILEGEVTLEAEGEKLLLGPGVLVHIPAGVAHVSMTKKDAKIFFTLIG